MKRCLIVSVGIVGLAGGFPLMTGAQAGEVDRIIASENKAQGVKTPPAPIVNDLVYLRRVTVDLIGRIPTFAEIREYQAWPAKTRRQQVVDKLLKDERFTDRWTVFFADMLRLRSNTEGGAALIAWVHRAVEQSMPYDEMCRRLIATNGKLGRAAEIGFVLGDNADPMALTGVTSQVFMGVRMACAQCHDHPFDVWTREDFYGLAAYFGKTRRIENRFNRRTLSIYTTDVAQTSVLWPPEGVGDDSERKPVKPKFPVKLAKGDGKSRYIARLSKLRAAKQQASAKKEKSKGPSIDDLLADAATTALKQTKGDLPDKLDVAGDAKRDVRKLNIQSGRYSDSELRSELAQLITSPRNRLFSQCFVNRVWAELIGRGFVNPIDDFSEQNQPSHPQALDYLADEFVAGGYDLRSLVRMTVTSDVYQRAHATEADDAARNEMEIAFLATPMRRMISEVLYDSIVVAGHLVDVKHVAGKNLKTVWRQTRVLKRMVDVPQSKITPVALDAQAKPAKAMPAKTEVAAAGYNLEQAIELDFDALLNADEDDSVQVDKMQVMSKEELEAERMQQEMRRRQAEYFDRFTKAIIDDNPKFSSSMRMASPAPPGHFLRVFGQTSRAALGETRDHNASMRQALMILNGRLTHEASRVGELEPVYHLLVGKQADLAQAIRLAYAETLTREPSAEEIADAKLVIADAKTPLEGMADLRWVLLNGNEFRFLP